MRGLAWIEACRTPAVRLTTAGSLIVLVTTGTRMSLGLFVSPLNSRTGLGLAAISLALAVGQFTWGAVQPLAGAMALRFGASRVLAIGLLLMAAGCVLTPLAATQTLLIGTLGLLMMFGNGAASFSVLFGAVAHRLAPTHRAAASGIINTGSSLGQFVFAPTLQAVIGAAGSTAAFFTMAAVSIAALPLVRVFRSPAAAPGPAPTRQAQGRLGHAVRQALRDPSYQFLNAGFFTCGFHIAFLTTHLPGEVRLCGLSSSVAGWSLALIGLGNVAGSLWAGFAMRRHRGKTILFWLYSARAAMLALYLMSNRSALALYVFSAGLGLTWLATIPPTAGLVGKLFDTRYLATLFGLALISHQLGGFFGAWLGGLAVNRWGNYDAMFLADAALACMAALLCLPIREAHPRAEPAAA